VDVSAIFVMDAPALRVKLTVSESNFRVMIDLVMQQKGDSE
jgi:hypothetical protein